LVKNSKAFFAKKFENAQDGKKVQTVLNLINSYKKIKK